MSANITKKSDATGYLNQSIILSIDPYLTPTPIIPIKSGNLKQYLNRFIEWIFPGTPTDVRGKVLGVPHSDTANTDYSGLEWLTMMPLGGITMYAVNGINRNVGSGVYKAMINTVDPLNAILQNYNKELDGFLFCDGSTINVGTGSGNEKYKELQKLLNGYYGNDINSMSEITPSVYKKDLLYLPNMNGRVPLGFVVTQDGVYTEDVSSFKDKVNYGKTGNVGGVDYNALVINQMPKHTHNYLILNHKFVADNSSSSGERAANSEDFKEGLATSATGGDPSNPSNNAPGARIENRQKYMVLSYIIKY